MLPGISLAEVLDRERNGTAENFQQCPYWTKVQFLIASLSAIAITSQGDLATAEIPRRQSAHFAPPLRAAITMDI